MLRIRHAVGPHWSLLPQTFDGITVVSQDEHLSAAKCFCRWRATEKVGQALLHFNMSSITENIYLFSAPFSNLLNS